jgi:hypothetical protein
VKGVFPLYEDDGVPEDMALTARQLESVAEVRQKLLSGVYEMIPCRCLCGNGTGCRSAVSYVRSVAWFEARRFCHRRPWRSSISRSTG